MLNKLISRAIKLLLASIENFISIKRFFVISSDQSEESISKLYSVLTEEEKNLMIECIRTAPRMHPQL